MRIVRFVAAALLSGVVLLAPALAQAHASVTQTFPLADASLSETPAQLRVNFSAPLHLTYVALQAAEGKTVKLELPRGQMTQAHVLPMPPLPPGRYLVEWRAMSNDGHVMKGSWQFELLSK